MKFLFYYLFLSIVCCWVTTLYGTDKVLSSNYHISNIGSDSKCVYELNEKNIAAIIENIKFNIPDPIQIDFVNSKQNMQLAFTPKEDSPRIYCHVSILEKIMEKYLLKIECTSSCTQKTEKYVAYCDFEFLRLNDKQVFDKCILDMLKSDSFYIDNNSGMTPEIEISNFSLIKKESVTKKCVVILGDNVLYPLRITSKPDSAKIFLNDTLQEKKYTECPFSDYRYKDVTVKVQKDGYKSFPKPDKDDIEVFPDGSVKRKLEPCKENKFEFVLKPINRCREHILFVLSASVFYGIFKCLEKEEKAPPKIPEPPKLP